jgi:hypothetical protein
MVNGDLDSTLRAVVTELVEPAGRPGVRLAGPGRGLGLLSGVVLGVADDQSITLVVALVVGVNAVAPAALSWVLAQLWVCAPWGRRRP